MEPTYKVEFSVNDLSLIEQEHLYKDLLKYFPQYKSRLNVKVIDGLNGEHNLIENYGISPIGEKCDKCVAIDCMTCKKYRLKVGLE